MRTSQIDSPFQLISSRGESPTDSEIWNRAKDLDLIILTKDADFSHRIAASNPPPRVVHIRVGNMRLRQFVAFLEAMSPRIERHFPASKLINVYVNRIEIMRN